MAQDPTLTNVSSLNVNSQNGVNVNVNSKTTNVAMPNGGVNVQQQKDNTQDIFIAAVSNSLGNLIFGHTDKDNDGATAAKNLNKTITGKVPLYSLITAIKEINRGMIGHVGQIKKIITGKESGGIQLAGNQDVTEIKDLMNKWHDEWGAMFQDRNSKLFTDFLGKKTKLNVKLEGIKDLQDLYKMILEVEKQSPGSSKTATKDLQGVIGIIQSLRSISYIKRIDLKKMEHNAKRIKQFIRHSLGDLLKAMEDATKDVNKDQKNIKIAVNNIFAVISLGKELAKFTLIAPFAMIGAVMLGATLKVLKVTIVRQLVKNQKEFKLAFEAARSLSVLAIATAAIIVIAGLTFKFIKIRDVIGFSGLLLALVAGLVYVYTEVLGERELKTSLESAKGFAYLLAASMGVMIVGSLAMKIIDIVSLLEFTVLLTFFVAANLAMWEFASSTIEGALDAAKGFAKLITTSAVTLMIGAIFIMIFGTDAIIKFEIILGAFIVTNLLMWRIAAKAIDGALKAAAGFSLLIVVSAAVLMIGALFLMEDPMRTVWIAVFEILLGAFVFGILLIFSKHTLEKEKIALVAVAGLAIILVVAAGVLLGAGWIIAKNPWLLVYIPLFGLELLLTIQIIIWASELLYNRLRIMQKALPAFGMAALIIAGAEALMWAMGKAMKPIAEVAAMTDALDLIGTILISFATIAAVIVGAFMLGTYVNAVPLGLGWTMLTSGAAIVASAAAIVWEIGKAMQAVAKAALYMDAAKNVDMGKVVSQLKEFMKIGGVFANGFTDEKGNSIGITTILGVSWAMSKVANTLSIAAKAIQDLSVLRVPVYSDTKKDKNGLPVVDRYINIGNKEFSAVTTNIELIITSLARGLVNGINGHPEYFKVDISALPWMTLVTTIQDSPAMNAAKVVGEIGKSLTTVARSVKMLADFKVPVYKNGKITDYITIKSGAFQKVSENIESLIISVMAPLVGVVSTHPEYFGKLDPSAPWSSFLQTLNSSPVMKAAKVFAKVTESIKPMAEGVNMLANMQVPLYETRPDGSQRLKASYGLADKNFKNVVATNIENLIMSVINGIVKATEGHEKELGDDFWGNLGRYVTGQDKMPVQMAVEVLAAAASPLASMADMVRMMGTGKFPYTVTEKGKAVNYVANIDFDAATDNIAKLIKTLILTPYQTINDSKEVFAEDVMDIADELFGSDKKFGTLFTAITGVINTLVTDKNMRNMWFRTANTWTHHVNAGMRLLKNIFYAIWDSFTVIDGNKRVENESIVYVSKKGDNIKKAIDKAADILKSVNTLTAQIPENNKKKSFSFDGVKTLFNALSNMASHSDTDNLNNILDSYAKFIKSVSEMHGSDVTVKGLSDMVKNIDAVDIQHVSAMTSMMKAMTNLGRQFGNIDKLIDAITIHLTGALAALVDRIKTSEETINNANKVQRERHQLIQDSIEEVKKIMSGNINVTISQQATAVNQSVTPYGGTGSTGEEGGGAGGGADTDAGRDTGGGSSMPQSQTDRNSADAKKKDLKNAPTAPRQHGPIQVVITDITSAAIKKLNK